MKIFKLLIAVLLFLSTENFAQIELVKRIEYDDDEKGSNYEFFNMDQEGGIMTFSTYDKRAGKYTRHFQKMDNMLNDQSSSKYSKAEHLNYYYTDYNDELICYMDYSEKYEEYLIHTIQKSTLSIKSVSGNFPKKCRIEDFFIVDDKLFIYLFSKKERLIMIIDPETGVTSEFFPDMSAFKKISYISSGIIGKEENPEFHIKYEIKTREGDYKYYIYRYKSDGKLINNKPMIIDVGPEKEIYHIRLTHNNKGRGGYLIAGTYSNTHKGLPIGLFTGSINSQGEVNSYKLNNFLDLEHFTEFLTERRQDRIEDRKDYAKSKGREITYKGRAALHNFYYHEDKNYLISEFYYPTYRTEYYTDYVDGKAVKKSRRVFDGYQYTHALIALIDNDGKILWTHIFKMWLSYKPYSVVRYIRKSIDSENNLELSYANSSGLRFMTFTEKGEVLREKKFNYIETDNEDDDIKYTSGSEVMFWYDNYYIVSGFQKIKDTESEKGEKKKRKVYFFNMIKY